MVDLLRRCFLVLLVPRHRPSLGQVVVRTLNHTTCNVDLLKAVETLIHRKCYGYVFFMMRKIKFFGFIKAFDSKGILNTLKKGIMSAMECTDIITVFTFTT